MHKNIFIVIPFLAIFLFSCSPQATTEPIELTAAIPTVQPPNTSTPFPTATRIPTQTPIPTDTVEPTIRATIPPLPTATEIIVPTIEPTAVPLTQTYATAFSISGEPITVFEFGTGDTDLILIGGMHGGYEWNTVLLMYEIIDWLNENIDVVPKNMKVSVIPVMNPDGLKLITGSSSQFSRDDVPFNADPGRFNANGVDLNRNWNCVWEPIGFWRGQEVDAGDFPESEKEVQSIRFFIQEINPAGVIFYHSAAGSLYPGYCNGIVADGTDALVNAYEGGSGFPQPTSGGVVFSYPVTGGAADYLATINIAAFEVELTNHKDTEFERNRDGLLSIFELLGEQPAVESVEASEEEIECPPENEPFELTGLDDPASYIGRHFDEIPFGWDSEAGFVIDDIYLADVIQRDNDYIVWLEETICRYANNGGTSPYTEITDILFLPLEENSGNGPRIITHTCWFIDDYLDSTEDLRDRGREDIVAIGQFDNYREPPTRIDSAWIANTQTGKFEPLDPELIQCYGILGL
ncbi:MAG: M14 family zinc carboxypeptidase [Anaerolineae bacterium]